MLRGFPSRISRRTLMFPSQRGLYIWDRILAAGRGRPSRVFARPILDRLKERLSLAANLFAIGSPAGIVPLIVSVKRSAF